MFIANTSTKVYSANALTKALVVMAVVTLTARLLPADTSSGNAPALPPLKVSGNQIMANGKPIHFRGIDWGWWHLTTTKYSEKDMQPLPGWGANVIRLAFSYNDLETDDNTPVWKEDGFKALDDVVQWGKKYGIYVILDMHVAPGGQSTQPYCAGGHNLIWTDAASQKRFIDLWTEIARRYHDRPEVAAYDLINEPDTTQDDPQLVVKLEGRAIDAIRAVDPDKIIAVGGNRGSGTESLTDAMKFADNNILYTIHFYEATGHFLDKWLSTDQAGSTMSGTQDWTKYEKTCTVPANADQMDLLLRSDNNSGTAWFDDIQVTDSTGKVLQSTTFDTDVQGYRAERETQNVLDYDSSTGHDKPGSLKVHNTLDYDGWASQYIPVQPGQEIHVSGWVKLDQATGNTYIAGAYFQNKTAINRDLFQSKLTQTADFSTKYNVPVWVGEFGCEASDLDYQSDWVGTCISLFEQNGFSWTYWNDKEAGDSPTGMGLRPEQKDGSDSPMNTSLLATLRNGWSANNPPAPSH
jgi:endoglucanase